MQTFRIKERIFLIPFFSLLLVFSSCQKDAEKENPTPIAEPVSPEPQNPNPGNPDNCVTRASADNGKAITNEYIVAYRESQPSVLSEAPTCIINSKIPANLIRKLYHGNKKMLHARLDREQLQRLQRDPEVESIEPDRVVSIVSCYTDAPSQTTPWGVQRVGYGDGTGKTVWIIDTGIDLDHPDLNVDASRSKSWVKGATPNDDHGHGTHVAGTIAAKNNQIGVLGVAANATVIALKVMDSTGRGSTSNIIAAVNYVNANGKAGDVVNMSVGGDISESLNNAIIETANKGILFAVAAGNNSMDASQSSPANTEHTNVFTISAMNNEDTFASFSNFGNVVDYCAPGVNIPSTYKNGGFATMSGTSMATPHVAGLLALKGRNILTDGFVKDDPDGKADPIAHK